MANFTQTLATITLINEKLISTIINKNKEILDGYNFININTSSLAKGTYTLKITTKDNSINISTKIIKNEF